MGGEGGIGRRGEEGEEGNDRPVYSFLALKGSEYDDDDDDDDEHDDDDDERLHTHIEKYTIESVVRFRRTQTRTRNRTLW